MEKIKVEIKQSEACRKTGLKNCGRIKVQFHQILALSKSFSGGKLKADTKVLFMPGCSLSGYRPDLVNKMFGYLKENISHVELYMQCCGQPVKDIGNEKRFQTHLEQLQKDLELKQIKMVVVACENCFEVYKKHLQSVEIKTIWEIIAEYGLPDHIKQKRSNMVDKQKTFALHDPCRIRMETQIHDSVRWILKELKLEFQEFEHNRKYTHCCGSIHMNHELNPDKYKEMATKRAMETEAEYIICYCQSCVHALNVCDKKTIHLGELVFSEDIKYPKSQNQKSVSTFKAWKNRWKFARKK